MKKRIKRLIKRMWKTSVKKDKNQFIFNMLKEYTMIPENIYLINLNLVEKFLKVPGAIVECGTWKGGMIAGIAVLLKNNREYYLFDSFQGLPEVKAIDGLAAKEWQADTDSSIYFDNCTASENDAKKAMEISRVENYKIKKGWFNETLPNAKFNRGIAILRLDGDWYESTMDILNNLFKHVNEGGLIIIDDYYVWEGCSKAVHDFLSYNKRSENIMSQDGVCYIIKKF